MLRSTQKTPDREGYLALSRAVLQRKNSLNEAITVLRTGSKQTFDTPSVYVALGKALLLREKNLKKATAMLHQGIQKFPYDTRVYTTLTQALNKALQKRKKWSK